MIVLANGMYRSGSTLVYNIARLILETTRHGIGIGGVDFEKINQLSEKNPLHLWVVGKIHHFVPSPMRDNVLPIYTYRNPYDMMASSLRIGKKPDLAAGLPGLKRDIRMYFLMKERGGLIIRYETIIEDDNLNGIIWVIAEYLNIHLKRKQHQEIWNKVNPIKVKEFTDNIGRYKADPITELRHNHIGPHMGSPGQGSTLPQNYIDFIGTTFTDYLEDAGYAKIPAEQRA